MLTHRDEPSAAGDDVINQFFSGSDSEQGSNADEQLQKKCGFVAIVGRPNVGKSTLLNHVLGQKVSITSRKPQTTRHRVLGIKTERNVQAIYVDTPGMHKREPKAINRYMNRAASSTLYEVDLVVMIVDSLEWFDSDDWILEKLKQEVSCPVILAVNKIDKLKARNELLPFLESVSDKYNFSAVVPIAAKSGHNLNELEKEIESHLPENDFIYPDDQVTDRSQRFMVAEMIREKVMRQLGQEIPYELTVDIESFKTDDRGIYHIDALIYVEKNGQKAIVIGKQGERLKKIGSAARKDMETMLDAKVMLQIWVKVKSGWSDSERVLRSLGYDE